MILRIGLVTILALPVATAPAAAQGSEGTPAPGTPVQATDSAAVVAVVDAFHRALEAADTAAVRDLLADDVIVEEGGGLEDRAEYLSHHLPADMAFARAVEAEREAVRVHVRGDMAWVASTSRRVGRFRDRDLDLRGAELMVLTRTPAGWRIAAIHWSSRSGG